MPRRDRTGPIGMGTLTGRGLGPCSRTNLVRGGAGLGLGWLLARRRFGNQVIGSGIRRGVGLCPLLGLGLGFRRWGRRTRL